MAKDPSKKGIRRVPPDVLAWIEDKYNRHVRNWYKRHVEKGRGEATRQRQEMSELAGKTGAFHEGHMRGAKDIDPEFGGGPTSGAAMRPEIGEINVAHGEKPRIPKADMTRAGIPQNWMEDFYEAVLEADGMAAIDGLDIQGALAMDRGMSFEQASALSRQRADLRAQGEQIPGDRFKGDRPAPITNLPAEQVKPPKIDASKIKEGDGIPRIVGESRRTVPDFSPPELRVKGGAIRTLTRRIPGGIDDVILGGGAALFAGATTLISTQSPTQAAEAFSETAADYAVSSVMDQISSGGTSTMDVTTFPDGQPMHTPEGYARLAREREEQFQQNVVQPFNQVMNFVGGVVKMIPSGVRF